MTLAVLLLCSTRYCSNRIKFEISEMREIVITNTLLKITQHFVELYVGFILIRLYTLYRFMLICVTESY